MIRSVARLREGSVAMGWALRLPVPSWVAVALFCGGCSVLGCGGSQVVNQAEPSRGETIVREQAARRPEQESRGPGPRPPETGPRDGVSGFVRWCSSGGAPIVGKPVIDEQERAYVVTSDGYLHAFERDGRFRWSYTVKGTPLGSVSLRPSDGAILMGTTAQLVYAIRQSGHLQWSFRTLSPVWSGLFALNDSTVVFLGHDMRLYALGNTGRARYRVRAPGEPMGGPLVAEGDVVWLPLADGVARFEAAFRLKKYPLTEAIEQIVVLGTGIVARGGGQAFFVSAEGESKVLGPARFVSSDTKRALIVAPDDSMRWLDESLNPTPVPSWDPEQTLEMSEPPVLEGDRVWIPTSSGVLVIAPLEPGEPRRVVVSKGPLSTPVVGKSQRWALVPEPGGQFCAVELKHR